MRAQANRLDQECRHLGGVELDRARPVRFRLDGRIVQGFSGDSVLSALLASGIDTLGHHLGAQVGLRASAAPAISFASLARDPQRALPMTRTPAIDGAEFVTLGGRRSSAIKRLFQPGRTLGLELDDPAALQRPWREVPAVPLEQADLVVVGGGVAGMSAALAAARAGLKVIIVDMQARLGGQSGLFGTQEGEDSPEESMERLSRAVRDNDAISVILRAEVFALRSGRVRLHQVEDVDGSARGRVLDIDTGRIVLATGSRERLPVFAGNRLPGVVGALEAYELAHRFGVWPGTSAILATASNVAYRLSILASDAGVEFTRLLDSRPLPNSRFIAFTRAFGLRQTTEAFPVSADGTKAGGRLNITMSGGVDTSLTTQRIIVCGGWQPDLTLWHVAGGHSQWQPARHRLVPIGSCEGIAMAGSAAGILTRQGCIQSGADAIDLMLGRERKGVEDPVIDPIHETPDAALPVSAELADANPAYLDDGVGMLVRPAPVKPRWTDKLRRREPRGVRALSETPRPLAITEVAAGVELGLIPAAAAGIVAQERIALVPLAEEDDLAPDPAPVAADSVPDYLHGRFGPGSRLVRLTLGEARRLDPGMLVYRSSDVADPARAIGVVLRVTEAGPVALMAEAAITAGLAVTIREPGRTTPARITTL
ncbi:MAG: FAD-dependent oxidoreductase [Devosia sp.]|uniref:FAD-dependent oxidoreductase n=1 Tax=Devosia sp. TaxID=1871048 RepID=UPI0024CB8397|nr:FAD-dependent oxidoreductase [Devosia sp.]UYN99715.1 MAG: FAD-dependent oxidoreductase [Devosia sp.]